MADLPISGLTALTGANTASGDLLEIVDVSDTTMAATGTNKKITRDEMKTALLAAPGAIGGTTPAAGSFTTVAASGNITATRSIDSTITATTTGTANAGIFIASSGNGTTSARYAYTSLMSLETVPQRWDVGMYGNTNYTIYDQTAGAARGVFSSAGLAVTGAISATIESTVIGALNGGLVAKRSTNDSQLFVSYRTTPDAWVIGATYSTTGAYKPIIFATSDTERFRLPVAGGVQAVTTISVGNATPSASGAGITFPGTQNASSNPNTLDDYEEGDWTPADGSGAGLTLTVTYATYEKIGRQVTINALITYPTTADATAAAISGNPFTPAQTSCVAIQCNAVGLFTSCQLYSGTNKIYPATGAAVSATNVNLTGAQVVISATYFV